MIELKRRQSTVLYSLKINNNTNHFYSFNLFEKWKEIIFGLEKEILSFFFLSKKKEEKKRKEGRKKEKKEWAPTGFNFCVIKVCLWYYIIYVCIYIYI